MNSHWFVAFEGVIGVGKIATTRLLQKVFGAEWILEVVEENPFLSDFYQDQAKYAFQTQIFFLLSRFRQMPVAAPVSLARANLLSDYMLAKDSIFARLTLNPDELETHSRLYPLLAAGLPQPDIVVYLYAETNVLIERIARRDRPFERSISRRYIERLRGSYEEFFKTFDDAPLLCIDTNAMDFVGNLLHLHEAADRIRSRLGLCAFQESLL